MDGPPGDNVIPSSEWHNKSRMLYVRRVGDYLFHVAKDEPGKEWRWSAGLFDPAVAGGLRNTNAGGRVDSLQEGMAVAMEWLENKLSGELETVRKEIAR